MSGVSVSQEVPLSESESESCDSLIMAHMNLQASQSSIGEAHGLFDLQSNEGMSLQFSGDPTLIRVMERQSIRRPRI